MCVCVCVCGGGGRGGETPIGILSTAVTGVKMRSSSQGTLEEFVKQRYKELATAMR